MTQLYMDYIQIRHISAPREHPLIKIVNISIVKYEKRAVLIHF